MKYWVALDVVIGDYIVFPTFPCFKLFPLSANLAVRYKEIYSFHSWYTGVDCGLFWCFPVLYWRWLSLGCGALSRVQAIIVAVYFVFCSMVDLEGKE